MPAAVSTPETRPAIRHTGAHATRVIFIDLARALAVLFMLYGHTIDALLAPPYRTGLLFQAWQFQRGLTSCLFFLLSGFAFSIATTRHWPSHLTWSPTLVRRIRRFAMFVALGYAIRFPVPSFARLATASDAEWRVLLGVDVLQLIGTTFIIVQLLVMACRSRRVFGAVMLALGIALILVAPRAWSVDWTARLPLWLAAYLSPATGSQFPLVPWAAFILIGAALGQAYGRWGAAHLVGYANAALLAPGMLAMALATWLDVNQQALFGPGPNAFVPSNLLLRTGACLVILGMVAHASRFIAQLPHAFGAVAQESLVIYVLHLAIVYGSVWAPGLANAYGGRLSPGRLLPIIVLLIASMTLTAYAWNWLKHTHRATARWVSVGLTLLLIAMLL
jgi:uncharacterized membrane protein